MFFFFPSRPDVDDEYDDVDDCSSSEGGRGCTAGCW
jgi:hypothetical protein